MAEENQQNGATEPAQVQMRILAQYVRDLSFENVVAQKGAPKGEIKPEIGVQVSLDARKRDAENQFEVVCKYKVTSKNSTDDQPMFIIELEYGGVFMIQGVPEDQLHPFLMIECPRLLFPYARRIVSDVSRDGGFPQFNMEPIDFVALYRQELARRAEQSSEQATESKPA